MAKKPKPGRRPNGVAAKVRVDFTIDPFLLARLDGMAKPGHRSEEICQAIDSWVEAHE